MLNSMTGFGEAQGTLNGVSYVVEVKTLNSRYFKTSIKLPELGVNLEEHIDKLLRRRIARGAVQYVLRLKEVSASALFDIDEPALRAVVERLSRLGPDLAGSLDVGNLLSLPGMVRPVTPDEETAVRVRDKILELSSTAIDRVQQMRCAEGQSLEADLRGHCEAIRRDLEVIDSRGGSVVREYARRLQSRVDELLAEAKLKLDAETLAREVAVLADRSDISEELARLDSHLKQFEQICHEGGQAGRRLDFLCQEMLREANTIGSKATDGEIISRVVDVKCRIDRIKEQVQNVE